MSLPANSTAITIQDINFELGADNTQPRSLNDQSVRLITAGTGKTINTTSAGNISFNDLSTGYIPEYNLTALSSGSIYAAAVDSNGSIGLLTLPTTATTTPVLSRHYPSGQRAFNGYQLAFGGSNGSATAVSYLPGTIRFDSSNNMYYLYSLIYFSKYPYSYYQVLKIDSSGTFAWSSNVLSTTAVVTYTPVVTTMGVDTAGKVYLYSSGKNGTNNVVNILNGTTGALSSNISHNFSGLGITQVNLANYVNSPDSAYVYAVGTMANSTSTYPLIASINTTSGNAIWGSALANASFTITTNPSSVYSNGSIVVPVGGTATVALFKLSTSGALDTTNWPKTITYGNNAYGTLPAFSAIDNSDNFYFGFQSSNTSGINRVHTVVVSLDSTGAKRWERSFYAANTTTSGGFNSMTVSGNKILIAMNAGNTTGSAPTILVVSNSAGPKTGTFTSSNGYAAYIISTTTEATITNSVSGVTASQSLTPLASTGVNATYYNYITTSANNYANHTISNM